jgi:hypothetical protein
MFNFTDIYTFIPVSSSVGIGPGALLYPWPIMLLRRVCIVSNDVYNLF